MSTFLFLYTLPATTDIFTLSLHDALPISRRRQPHPRPARSGPGAGDGLAGDHRPRQPARRVAVLRSEEHTSELQSHSDLVCRLLLEKKKKIAGLRATRR